MTSHPEYTSLLKLRNDAIDRQMGDPAKVYQLSLVRIAGDALAKQLVAY